MIGPCVNCHRVRPWHDARGHCGRCYNYRLRHNVEWHPSRPGVHLTARRCQHRGCPRRVRTLTRGWCHRHYMRAWRLFGDRWRAERAAA